MFLHSSGDFFSLTLDNINVNNEIMLIIIIIIIINPLWLKWLYSATSYFD